ncbi:MULTISPECIES: HDOD domain-containing protein [unclassified Thauera]|uniref:HDOD domain-containing protein n=1 Tax=unclassified Thauera TaxID=2609274 RepID=UPI0021E16BA1|nr:HDOD domain-containing protein [Thauera sp. Sel9]MCV2218909.1 HDOD domain-containing protein [Thauera sp. Sel9]
MSTLHSPLPSVGAYVAYFTQRPLPVLRRTARELEALHREPEHAESRQLASIVQADPLMTMRLLTHLETHRRQSQNHDITTIERAVMMIGVEPFLRLFDALPTVEDALEEDPRALVGVLRVIARARRIAGLAREFAIMRHDLDVQEITVAASLHEATEIVCWIHAPALTEQVYALQTADRHLRSADAQRRVFGITANELQLGLVRAWRLPALLAQLLDDSQQNDPRVRTVSLAARLARHLAHGWDDPGLPDDLAELGTLLRIPRETLLRRLGAPEEALNRLATR